MKHIIKFILFCSYVFQAAFAQDTKSIFFEKEPHNMVRFYYDTDYYLVDKDCEFKFIERVAGFDIANNKFHGIFKDFHPNGRTILTGNYENGRKEGEFFAYYPDGTIKWKANFVNNIPQGKVEYFYPDGKPMLILSHSSSTTYINQYWNKTGIQDIKDGEGTIDITLPIIGFTEHGFTKYNTSGKIANGLPQGLWYTNFVTDDKKNKLIPFMVSAYDNGQLRERAIDDFFEPMLIDLKTLTFSPTETFQNGELLQSKNCSFDEHTGFNSFLANKFLDYLNKNNYKTEIDQTLTLTYTTRVTKNGNTYAPTITEASRELTKSEKMGFEHMIKQIYYYLPSYLGNKSIDDQLTISLQIITQGDLIIIPPLQISREKGF